MADILDILTILDAFLHIGDVLIIIVYCIPMIINAHFWKSTYLYILNIAVGMLIANIYLIVYFILMSYAADALFMESTCALVFYMRMMSTCQAAYTIILFTINRFCLIVFPTKYSLKTIRWTKIAIATQWIIGFLISIPRAQYFSVKNSFDLVEYMKKLLMTSSDA